MYDLITFFPQVCLNYFLALIFMIHVRNDFRFLLKKNNQIEFFYKKTETEPKPIQIDRFQ